MFEAESFSNEFALRILVSLFMGTILGLEREYRSKAAGLRTMIMICIGSTIFTEISLVFNSETSDRIAANIITGIGFLGAGVIFKDGLTVSGITTATTIWICAALGMAVGAGLYILSFVALAIVIIVLIAFEKLKKFISKVHQSRSYRITHHNMLDFAKVLENEVKRLRLKCVKERDIKNGSGDILVYEIYGREENLDALNIFLKNNPNIKAYEY